MSICTRKRAGIPNAAGLNLGELPVGLWVIFVGIGIPVLCLSLTIVRYGLFLEIARQAADTAAQAQSYITASSRQGGTEPATGAVFLAQNKVMEAAFLFSGLNINPDDVKCWILVTPIYKADKSRELSAVIGPNIPLVNPADPSKNLYQLRVDISGQIQPMISARSDTFFAIPGFNIPVPVKASMTRVFENPQGLSM